LTRASTIAIDGPAASGKSTVGARVAARLGYLCFDTGLMYRAVTWAALQRGVEIDDETAVTLLAQQIVIEVLPPTVNDGRPYTVLADGEDVTWAIRSPAVDGAVSPVSEYSGVREALTTQQRRIGLQGTVVMLGRDIGTVVMPDADLKIYLDADVTERARRRHQEVLQRGQASDYGAILEAMRRRDRIDSGRELAPLQAAPDAVVVDSTNLAIDQVVDRILALAENPALPTPGHAAPGGDEGVAVFEEKDLAQPGIANTPDAGIDTGPVPHTIDERGA
jgi:cytidylate kinase